MSKKLSVFNQPKGGSQGRHWANEEPKKKMDTLKKISMKEINHGLQL